MVLLVIVTLGVYYMVWFFRRRPGLNRLDSRRKLPLWPLLMFAAYFGLQVVLAVLAGDATPEQVWGSEVAMFLSLMQLAVAILMLVQCFAIKDIIEDHAQGPDGAAEHALFSAACEALGAHDLLLFDLLPAIRHQQVRGRRTVVAIGARRAPHAGARGGAVGA